MIESRDAIELAFGKGNLKKWALSNVLMDVLYSTHPTFCAYLKLNEVSKKDYDEETEDEYLVYFGYLFRVPQSVITLHINKKTHLLYAVKGDMCYGEDKVEDAIVDYLVKHKKNKNLFWQSNVNHEVFQIK